jgi:hypothetical protein
MTLYNLRLTVALIVSAFALVEVTAQSASAASPVIQTRLGRLAIAVMPARLPSDSWFCREHLQIFQFVSHLGVVRAGPKAKMVTFSEANQRQHCITARVYTKWKPHSEPLSPLLFEEEL